MYQSTKLQFFAKFYSLFIRCGSNLQSLFLLYMRLTWGHQFFLFGLQKLGDIDKTAAFFQSLHIPSPLFHAYFVGGVECVGGFLLVIGLASRLIALPLTVILLVALNTAHAQDISNLHFFFEPLLLVKQPPYPFLITTLLMFIFGPGRISFDGWLKRWAQKQPTI